MVQKIKMVVNNTNFLFDIDGTLTPSRSIIDKDFKIFFLKWMENKSVYLVTGSDKEKTIEQIGTEIWSKVKKSYQSCGNAVYQKGNLIRKLDFNLEKNLQDFLNNQLNKSEWKEKYSLHIDQRIGLINFSTIGRECPKEARERYFNWDKEKNERKMICEKIEEKFPLLEASVGGEISIDIYPKGKNKSQVLDEIYGPVVFFGDRCEKGGNDYPIVKRLETEINKRNYTINNVSHFKETWEILKKI